MSIHTNTSKDFSLPNNHTPNTINNVTNALATSTIHNFYPNDVEAEADQEDSGNESDYSLDYEFPGPRFANYRPTAAASHDTNDHQELDDVASELSFEEDDNNLHNDKTDDDDDLVPASEETVEAFDAGNEHNDNNSQPIFDMWDDDPYNDFTWESNDMQLTKFMKKKRKQLSQQQQERQEQGQESQANSFWNKGTAWPKQLPYSCSSTNHDQSANAICLVQSNYGIKEKIYAVYRDRIIECGRSPPTSAVNDSGNNCHENSKIGLDEDMTWLESNNGRHRSHSNHDNSSHKFISTHQSISLSKISQMPSSDTLLYAHNKSKEDNDDQLITRFKHYSKFIKRKDYNHGLQREYAYLSLGFDPQCLDHRFGYMAIGGVEGEFELYCCMKQNERPIKIWGTKFKGKNNVMLMTNAIQIIRLKNGVTQQYEHMLIACMNEAGLLFYNLPSHHQCQHMLASGVKQRNKYHQSMVTLHSHLRSFQGVPINDAKLSPDGRKIVCVGDDNMVFMIDVYTCSQTGKIQFSTPHKITIPTCLLQPPLEEKTSDTTSTTASHTTSLQHNYMSSSTIASTTVSATATSTTTPSPSASSTSSTHGLPYSSQYVAWSPSSQYFAHTSDSHDVVFVWKADTREIIYAIDAVGYSYAIAFHPHLDHILTFTNRYGYFHTVDLTKVSSSLSPISSDINILQFNPFSRDHTCTETCILSREKDVKNHAIFHSRHLDRIQHEITMVSFRGEVDTRLRILAKINGIEWSKDGKYLYVATKKRILAYQFLETQHIIPSLMELTSRHVKRVFEEEEEEAEENDDEYTPLTLYNKRMKINHDTLSTTYNNNNDNKTTDTTSSSTTINTTTATITSNSLLKTWNSCMIPYHLHYRVIGQNDQLACHW